MWLTVCGAAIALPGCGAGTQGSVASEQGSIAVVAATSPVAVVAAPVTTPAPTATELPAPTVIPTATPTSAPAETPAAAVAPTPTPTPTSAADTGSAKPAGTPAPISPPPAAAASFLQVNLSGYENGGNRLNTNYVLPSEATLRYYLGKGVNTFRLPMLWERLQPKVGGPLDEAKAAELDAFLDIAARVGARIVPDLHNYGGRDNHKLGDADLPTSALANFWGKFAVRFKGHPAIVGYDLMNEPNGLPGAGYWPQAAQQATNAIAAVDPNEDIYVEGDGWSGAQNWVVSNGTWLNVRHPVDQQRIIYSAHTYWDNDRSGRYNGVTAQGENADSYRGHWQLDQFLPWVRARGARAHIGEFGTPADASWQPLMAEFSKAALANRDVLTGVAYWAGGEWMGNYPLTVQPTNGKDRPQMTWMLAEIGHK